MTLTPIFALLKANWITLCRDRIALALTFVLPMIFFTLFAFIFSGSGGGGGSKASGPSLRVVVLNTDDSEVSSGMADALLDIDTVAPIECPEDASDEDIIRMVRTNKADAAVIFPEGLGNSIGTFGSERPSIQVIYDPANPVASQMLTGVLQGAAFTAAPNALMKNGLKQFQEFGGPMTAQQQLAIAAFDTFVNSSDAAANDDPASQDEEGDKQSDSASSGFDMSSGLVAIDAKSVRDIPLADEADTDSAAPKKGKPGSMTSYYAASLSVMFLMFSMAGASASLLQAREDGTLDRLISGQMTVSMLIISQWLFFVLMGLAQLAVMFVFAWAVFSVDFSRPSVIVGTAIMSVVTSMASAAFVMALATICKSRKQLEGISTIVILVMSALGGSMMPRFILPPIIQKMSKVTFNGWAIDGFTKVLWYYDPGQSLVSQIGLHAFVLLAMTCGFLFIASRMARKWAVA